MGTEFYYIAFVNFRRVEGCPVLGPRGTQMGTLREHETTLQQGQTLSPIKHVHYGSILLERRFALSVSNPPLTIFPSQITQPLLEPLSFYGTLLRSLSYLYFAI